MRADIQQFVGINALIYYSPSLFETLGLDSQLQLHMSGVMNLAQLVAVTASFFVFDKIGRKPLLIIGSAGMAASHAIVAIMIALYSDNWAAHGAQAWVGVAFIIVFMLFFVSCPLPFPCLLARAAAPLCARLVSRLLPVVKARKLTSRACRGDPCPGECQARSTRARTGQKEPPWRCARTGSAISLLCVVAPSRPTSDA